MTKNSKMLIKWSVIAYCLFYVVTCYIFGEIISLFTSWGARYILGMWVLITFAYVGLFEFSNYEEQEEKRKEKVR